MLLGSPPDMVHRAPAHGAHIRMQNSAITALSAFCIILYPLQNCKGRGEISNARGEISAAKVPA